MKTFYIQATETGKITDVIEYAHAGYVPVELAVPLPPGILGGAYQLVGQSAIYRPEWDYNAELRALEAKIDYIGMMTEVEA